MGAEGQDVLAAVTKPPLVSNNYNPVWKPVIVNKDVLAPNGNQVSILPPMFLSIFVLLFSFASYCFVCFLFVL
jgi:hypothetical protein